MGFIVIMYLNDTKNTKHSVVYCMAAYILLLLNCSGKYRPIQNCKGLFKFCKLPIKKSKKVKDEHFNYTP